MVLIDFKSAATTYVGIVPLVFSLLNPLTREIVERYMFTEPGNGPSMEAMEKNTICKWSKMELAHNEIVLSVFCICPRSPVVRKLLKCWSNHPCPRLWRMSLC